MKTQKQFIIIFGILSVIIWFVFFGMGLFINSKPYRDAVLQQFELKDFALSLLTYTPTNIALLCLAAAFCGGCSSNLIISGKLKAAQSVAEDPSAANTSVLNPQNPFNCMIRGFVVYVAFLAGMYVVVDAPFESTSPQQYARAAGVVSLLAYVVGYDQTNFLNLITLTSKFKKEA